MSAFPFCSERCKLIDLGRWLEEKYRIAVYDPDPDAPSGASDEQD
ncbi:MAG: DNA gyrase inhibitor YacG [Tepidisphaeraceae bacterium]